MEYKYMISGTGEENFGDLCDVPLLICSNRQIADTIKKSFTDAIKEVSEEKDLDSDIKFCDYKKSNDIYKLVKNDLKDKLVKMIASNKENESLDVEEINAKVEDTIEGLFESLEDCFVFADDSIEIVEFPYI